MWGPSNRGLLHISAPPGGTNVPGAVVFLIKTPLEVPQAKGILKERSQKIGPWAPERRNRFSTPKRKGRLENTLIGRMKGGKKESPL